MLDPDLWEEQAGPLQPKPRYWERCLLAREGEFLMPKTPCSGSYTLVDTPRGRIEACWGHAVMYRNAGAIRLATSSLDDVRELDVDP